MSSYITPPAITRSYDNRVYRKSKGILKLVNAPIRPSKPIETAEDISNAIRAIELMEEARRRNRTTFFNYLCNPNGISKQNYSHEEIENALEHGKRT